MPMALADSGKSTGVGLLVATGCVGLMATGGARCKRPHPQITITATQTAADLKGFILAPVVKDCLITTRIRQTAPLGTERLCVPR